jgi:hypothetical protein
VTLFYQFDSMRFPSMQFPCWFQRIYIHLQILKNGGQTDLASAPASIFTEERSCFEEFLLKMESQLRRQCTWRHIMRAAERGKKVVEGEFIGDVDRCQLQTDFVFIATEQIVVPD